MTHPDWCLGGDHEPLVADDYDGGEIQFPEYGAALYRPEAGSALVFPCALMHQVAKMKTGARYALISFLFGDDDARRWTERNGRDLRGMAVRGPI